MRPLFLILVIFFQTTLNAQDFPPPKNDACKNAISLPLNFQLTDQKNTYATLGDPSEQPVTYPRSCVKSLENDMWYEFYTVEGMTYYQVDIEYEGCNTPAGLQAMIIRSESCDTSDFRYRKCASFENTDPIHLSINESRAGLRHLIYVDGYDGTTCNFIISLTAKSTAPSFRRKDYNSGTYNYDIETEPDYKPQNIEAKFHNSVFRLEWTADEDDNADYFIIERLLVFNSMPTHTRVMGIVDARNTTGGSGAQEYRFQDFRTLYREEKDYCYRIVLVDQDSVKHYGDKICRQAELVDGFVLGAVDKLKESPGKYQVHYINHIKKADYELSLHDINGKFLKGTTLRKEPRRDGHVTIDLSPYPEGYYLFKMTNGDETLTREFFHRAD